MSLFTRAFQHDAPRDRENWLRTLLDAGVVKEEKRVTAGRTASILIHRDFWEGPAAEAELKVEVEVWA